MENTIAADEVKQRLDEVKRRLEGLLHTFEAMKSNAENSIYLIKQDLERLEAGQYPAPMAPIKPITLDPDVLGIDVLGRVIKKRKLSPEVLEKKRQIMRGIRDKRLRDIEELKKLREEKAAREKTVLVPTGATMTKKK